MQAVETMIGRENDVDNVEITTLWNTLTILQKHAVVQMITAFKADEFVLTEGEIDEYNVDILQAEESIARGEYVTHQEAIEKLSKWK